MQEAHLASVFLCHAAALPCGDLNSENSKQALLSITKPRLEVREPVDQESASASISLGLIFKGQTQDSMLGSTNGVKPFFFSFTFHCLCQVVLLFLFQIRS